RDGLSRREFAARIGAAAAGVAVGGDLFGSGLRAAPSVGRRILGANDRVVLASIGIRGQGNALKRGFARLKNVEHKTLCDIDANLAAVRDAIKLIHDGGLGKVYMARGLCFKPRPSIGKYPDGPMAPGEKYALTVTSTSYEPAYDEQYLSKVDYDLWLGPAPKRPFNRNRFHYNWHWHWDYGNGDTGNQGPHQFDIARWGLQKQEHPVKIRSVGGYFGDGESSQETPNEQTTMYEYADGTVMEFGTRGGFTNDEAGVRIGNLFYGTKGW